MTFILDMSSGKEYLGEELSCPFQSDGKILQPDAARNAGYPALKLAKVESSDSEKRPALILPGVAIDSLLESIED